MNTEDMLEDLFAREADRRPDATAVLDVVHQRIARRGRVRVTRAASTLGAAAAVAAIAVATTLVAAPSHHSDPAGGAVLATRAAGSVASQPVRAPAVQPAAPSTPGTAGSAVSAPLPGVPGSARPAGGAGYSTIDAGWLPGPATQDPAATSNQSGFEQRDWDVTVDGVAMDVIIWTESGSLPSRMQATGGSPDYRSITVNGHPGREFVSSNITIVAFDLGDGTIAYAGPSVAATTATVTSARITAIAVKVAQNMQFNQHDPIPGA